MRCERAEAGRYPKDTERRHCGNPSVVNGRLLDQAATVRTASCFCTLMVMLARGHGDSSPLYFVCRVHYPANKTTTRVVEMRI